MYTRVIIAVCAGCVGTQKCNKATTRWHCAALKLMQYAPDTLDGVPDLAASSRAIWSKGEIPLHPFIQQPEKNRDKMYRTDSVQRRNSSYNWTSYIHRSIS